MKICETNTGRINWTLGQSNAANNEVTETVHLWPQDSFVPFVILYRPLLTFVLIPLFMSNLWFHIKVIPILWCARSSHNDDFSTHSFLLDAWIKAQHGQWGPLTDAYRLETKLKPSPHLQPGLGSLFRKAAHIFQTAQLPGIPIWQIALHGVSLTC